MRDCSMHGRVWQNQVVKATRFMVLLSGSLVVSLASAGWGQPELTCPSPELDPPPLTPPPYQFPLEIFGRWTAVPQCYNLWPAEPPSSTTICKNAAGNPDSAIDMFPRGLYSVHAALASTGKVAIWKQTHDLYFTSEFIPRMFYADPDNFASFSHEPIPVPSPALNSANDMFCSGHTVLPDGRVLIVGGTDHPQEVQDGMTAGHNRSFLLDPVAKTWSEQQQMHAAPDNPENGRRWYPTVTLLPDFSDTSPSQRKKSSTTGLLCKARCSSLTPSSCPCSRIAASQA